VNKAILDKAEVQNAIFPKSQPAVHPSWVRLKYVFGQKKSISRKHGKIFCTILFTYMPIFADCWNCHRIRF